MNRKKFSPHDPYTPPQEEKHIKHSALKIIEYVTKDADLHPDVRSATIHSMQWVLTEIKHSIKYRTRYFSENALLMNEEPRHEHVFTRKYVENLIYQDYDSFLKMVPEIVGCTVTKSEAQLLNKVDKQHQGWERYKQAGIKVFDRQDQRFIW